MQGTVVPGMRRQYCLYARMDLDSVHMSTYDRCDGILHWRMERECALVPAIIEVFWTPHASRIDRGTGYARIRIFNRTTGAVWQLSFGTNRGTTATDSLFVARSRDRAFRLGDDEQQRNIAVQVHT